MPNDETDLHQKLEDLVPGSEVWEIARRYRHSDAEYQTVEVEMMHIVARDAARSISASGNPHPDFNAAMATVSWQDLDGQAVRQNDLATRQASEKARGGLRAHIPVRARIIHHLPIPGCDQAHGVRWTGSRSARFRGWRPGTRSGIAGRDATGTGVATAEGVPLRGVPIPRTSPVSARLRPGQGRRADGTNGDRRVPSRRRPRRPPTPGAVRRADIASPRLDPHDELFVVTASVNNPSGYFTSQFRVFRVSAGDSWCTCGSPAQPSPKGFGLNVQRKAVRQWAKAPG